ncbi:MAG: ERF family protein [Lachnospiraceae bacterium]|nr:ERF family protein [Lachnospiraceae bacterium]
MNIFETIAAVMADIGAVGKTSKNTTQGFMFRGIDAVMNAINPALIKHKCFVVPEILEQSREERTSVKKDNYGKDKTSTLIYSICRVKYTFYAEDGSNISAIVVGEGMDSGDKATNKAMSVAFKYACFQVFCIPTEEMKEDDPDKESHEVDETKKEPTPPKTVEDKPISTTEAKALIDRCKKDNVPVDLVCGWYKIQALNDLTKKQYASLNRRWEEAVSVAASKGQNA